jgi:hypothetical protein
MIKTIILRLYVAFLFIIAGVGGAMLIIAGEDVKKVASYNTYYVGGR